MSTRTLTGRSTTPAHGGPAIGRIASALRRGDLDSRYWTSGIALVAVSTVAVHAGLVATIPPPAWLAAVGAAVLPGLVAAATVFLPGERNRLLQRVVSTRAATGLGVYVTLGGVALLREDIGFSTWAGLWGVAATAADLVLGRCTVLALTLPARVRLAAPSAGDVALDDSPSATRPVGWSR